MSAWAQSCPRDLGICHPKGERKDSKGTPPSHSSRNKLCKAHREYTEASLNPSSLEPQTCPNSHHTASHLSHSTGGNAPAAACSNSPTLYAYDLTKQQQEDVPETGTWQEGHTKPRERGKVGAGLSSGSLQKPRMFGIT